MKKWMTMLLTAVLLTGAIASAAAQDMEAVPAAPAIPAQTVKVETIDAEQTVYELGEVLTGCVGYAGTAGSSLKGAIAAMRVLEYCIGHQVGDIDFAAFAEMYREARAVLDEEQAAELDENMDHILWVIDSAFIDYPSAEGLLDSAGIAQDMKQLTESEQAYRHWMAFRMTQLYAAGQFEEALFACTGYEGTAGASLKEAAAACGLLRFCVDNRLGDVDDAALEYAVSEAYAALPQERMEEFEGNLEDIDRLIEQCYMDYDVYADLFEAAGIGEDMQQLIETEGSYAHWAAFRSQTMNLSE